MDLTHLPLLLLLLQQLKPLLFLDCVKLQACLHIDAHVVVSGHLLELVRRFLGFVAGALPFRSALPLITGGDLVSSVLLRLLSDQRGLMKEIRVALGVVQACDWFLGLSL